MSASLVKFKLKTQKKIPLRGPQTTCILGIGRYSQAWPEAQCCLVTALHTHTQKRSFFNKEFNYCIVIFFAE